MLRTRWCTAAVIVLCWPSLGWARSMATSDTTLGPPEVSEPAPAADRAVSKPRKTKRRRRVRRRRRWRRRDLVQLRSVPGLHVKLSKRAWGTKLAVERLQDVATAYHEQFPDASPIWIHDLSSRFGGRLPPHISHRNGRDVDIRLFVTVATTKYLKATPRMLDKERTWFLLKQLIDSGDVQAIFLDRRLQRALRRYALKQGYTRKELRRIFQYPRNPRAIVHHWKGHSDHMHVRFYKKPQTAGPVT